MATVLITGGTRGIGLALGKAFLSHGWDLTTCYHQDEGSAVSARTELAALSDRFEIVKRDVTVDGEVQELVGGALRKWGRIDLLVHNAGATWNARLMNIEDAQWDDTLRVHLKAAFLVSRSVLRPMMKQKDGQLVFISSVVATTGNIGQASYTAAKAGLIGLTRSLAREYGGKNIRCNAVLPGFHKTRLSDGLSPEAEAAIRQKHALPETTSLKEVGDFMLWLASTKTISGQVFNLDSRFPGWL